MRKLHILRMGGDFCPRPSVVALEYPHSLPGHPLDWRISILASPCLLHSLHYSHRITDVDLSNDARRNDLLPSNDPLLDHWEASKICRDILACLEIAQLERLAQ